MADATPTAPGHAGTDRALLRRVLWATVAGGAVFAGLALFADTRAFTHDLGQFRGSHFAGALALVSGNYALRYVRWALYLRRLGVRVPARANGLIFLAGFAMSVTPAKLGEVLKSVLLRDAYGIPIQRTAPIVLAERLSDLLTLVLLAAIGATIFPGGAVIAVLGAGVVAAGLIVCRVRAAGDALLGLVLRLPRARAAEGRLREAYEALHSVSRGGTFVAANALTLVGWTLEAAATWWLVRGFPGAEASPLLASFAYAVGQVSGALAFLPGGLGVTEAGMAGLLTVLGAPDVSPSVAAASTALLRLATLWYAVLLGVVALVVARRVLPRAESAGA